MFLAHQSNRMGQKPRETFLKGTQGALQLGGVRVARRAGSATVSKARLV